ncbi:ankyrin repeat protein [Colletotrichum orchidophilum]|uniref:Ankyrin repeat protein n=1 Tax=Colletotrichum orchidophilum TaxID=1209926 RepID=A0A1G4AYD4_9PEZI|nr:ankyrin repeat protein [Colletotrichum orchidophilum]OHE94115.1 ankyrin repeat protein [Colletotrichum orchidophilum]
MADPFGIIGVIGVVGQVVNAGVKLGVDWKEAPSDVRSFMGELEVLKTVLSETHMNIILNQDFKDAFEGRQSTVLSHLADGNSSSNPSARGLLSTCSDELGDLLKKLHKQSEGHCLGWQRLKGAFQSERAHTAVDDLQRRCRLLNSMVAIDNVAMTAATLEHVKCTRDEMRAQRIDENRARILEWITPIDYSAQQSDNLERRCDGTGQWLIDSAEFRTWVQTDKSILFCPGLPGAGKTILTSVVIDYLHTSLSDDPTIGVAYLFCNFRRQHEQTMKDILASLLKQLCHALPALPVEVQSLYEAQRRTNARPSTLELIELIRIVAASLTKTFILIDALDEIEHQAGDALLETIAGFQKPSNISLFATSRLIPSITQRFENEPTLEIRATDADVARYLDGALGLLPAFVMKNAELQTQIKTKIVESVHGMSPKAVKAALQKLATGSSAYDTAYDEAFERIEGQLEDQAILAKDALSWIVCSRRPLSVVELQEALAVERGAAKLDPENRPEMEDVVSACAGLLTIDEHSRVVRLVHYTTQEYFQRNKTRRLPEADSLVTTTCITYLMFQAFGEGPCGNWKQFHRRLEDHLLYDYAARNWGYHVQESSLFGGNVLAFLESREKLDASFQVLITIENSFGIPERPYVPPLGYSGLHVAAYFGIREAFKVVSNGTYSNKSNSLQGQAHYNPDNRTLDINAQDETGQTPLFIAVSRNFGDLIRDLIESYSADICKDKDGRTILSFAAQRGHFEIVKYLIESCKSHFDINETDIKGQTPLILALNHGNEEIANFLLEVDGINPNLKDQNGRTALFFAAAYGHESTVKRLHETGIIDANVKDSNGRSAFSYAAGYGAFHDRKNSLREDIISVRTGCMDRPEGWPGHQTMLTSSIYRLIAIRSNIEALRELHKAGADTNSQCVHGRTPLSYACGAGGSATIVRYLLELDDIEVDARDNGGLTPLAYAANKSDSEIVLCLLRTGKVDVNSRDVFGRPIVAQIWCPIFDDENVGGAKATKKIGAAMETNMLLIGVGGADPNLRDRFGQTLLWKAIFWNVAILAEYLVETGLIDGRLNLCDDKGRSPMDLMAETPAQHRREISPALVELYDRLQGLKPRSC